MRRAIASAQTWWVRLFILMIPSSVALGIPFPFDIAAMAVPLLLAFVRPPSSHHPPVDLSPPVRGRWVALNSPGSAVPSHGVKAYGQTYAVDLLPHSPTPPPPPRWWGRGRSPESYPAFGQPVLAMSSGTIVRARASQGDHRARSTLPSILWMITLEGFLRDLVGASGVLGNHVVLRHDDGLYSAYAHLRQDSTTVSAGERVTTGQALAEVGNTGNSSEPHLHVQLMDRTNPTAAAGIPMHWPRANINTHDRDPRFTKPPKPSAQPNFPANGHILELT